MNNLIEVMVDGEKFLAPEEATFSEIIPADVNSVNYLDKKGQLVTTERSEKWKQMPVAPYITTNITEINKG